MEASNQKSRRAKFTAAPYNTPAEIAALAIKPSHGSEPVRK